MIKKTFSSICENREVVIRPLTFSTKKINSLNNSTIEILELDP